MARKAPAAPLPTRDSSYVYNVCLNPLDCNLDCLLDNNNLSAHSLSHRGCGYCWTGVRANLGIFARGPCHEAGKGMCSWRGSHWSGAPRGKALGRRVVPVQSGMGYRVARQAQPRPGFRASEAPA